MSDASKSQRPSATPIKNPLLSASVTGLAADFPNNLILLPAAPPIVQTPVAPPSGLLSREPKSLVTLGSSSLDTENLDEINLNASNEDQQPPSIALTTDTNANTLLEQANNTNDSILSQAASSFSALPSVASNVFSTFSKRINAISSSRETTPISNDRFPEQFQQTDLNANNASLSQLNIQPAYIKQQQQQQLAQDTNYLQQQTPIQPFFGAAPQVQTAGYQTFQPEPIQNLPPAEPPKFYTPADIPLPNTAPPLASGGGNNFRFSAKKKLYAPIPGLTDQQAVPIFDPSAVSAPIIPEPPSITPYQHNTYPAPPPIESKVGGGGGLFSKITNLAPSGVLQNITGLVQSAAGSFTQTPRSDTSLQQQQQQPHQTLEYSGFNVFATQPTEIYSTGILETTPASNFFVHPPPPGQQPVQLNLKPALNQNQTAFTAVPNFPPQPEPTINFFDTTNSQAQSSNSNVNFFQAAQTLPATQQNIAPPPLACPTRPTRPSSRPPSHCADFVTNEALPPPASWNSNQQPSTVNLFDPSKFLPTNNQNNFAVAEPASKPSSRPASQPSVDNTQQGSIPLFDPSKYLQSTNQVSENITNPQPLADNNFGITAAKPSSRPPSQPNAAVVANNQFAPPLANSAADNVALFDPTKYLPTTNNQTHFAASPAINPLGFVAPPPTLPPPAGQTSHFRLQKGTRLYKNPLTAQETAPVQVTPAEIQQPLAFGSSATPFGLPNTHVDSYGQHINQQEIKSVPSFFVPSTSEAQSVPLFAPSVEETEKESNKKPQIESSLGSATTVVPSLFVPNASEASLLVEPPKEYQEQQKTATQPDSNFAPSAVHISNETASAAEQSDLFVSNSSDTQSLSLFAPSIAEYQAEVEEPPQNQTILQSNNLTQFEKSSEDPQDSLAADQVSEATLTQNLQTISLSSASEPQPPPPPASSKQEAAQIPPTSLSESNSSSNPYRRGSASGGPAKSHVNQTILASFFTPSPSTNTSSDFNFFGSFPAPTDNKNNEIDFFAAKDNQESISGSAETIPSSNLAIPEPSISNSQEQPSATNLQQPSIACFFAPSATEGIVETSNIPQEASSNIPNPIGFEKFGIPASDSAPVPAAVPAPIIVNENLPELQQTEQNPHEVVKRFSNIFQQTNPIKTENPSQFFDNFETQQQQDLQAEAPTQACKEDQRIQNFFNNPPPQDANKVGDLNYDLVHSGLAIKDLQHRSLITPISNLVEPSSSACSEFSEFSNITNTSLSQRSAAITSETVTQISPEKLTLPVQTEEEDKQPFIKRYEDLPEEILKELRMANQLSAEKGFGPTTSSAALYKPVVKHWFYKRIVEQKPVWTAFSHYDSALLETAYLMDPAERPNIVAVEGSRYDVNIAERKKMSAYWESDPIEVRRCSWFCKAPDSKYIPYEENIADLLEEQYKIAFEAGEWPKTIMLNMGEKIVFHGPAVIVHMQEKHNVDAWGGSTQTSTRPRVVERDLINIKIEQGESQKVDHLLFMVHGIGSACDLKMRPVEEVVEDFRTIAYQLVQSHYKNSTEVGVVGRVEVLPISWHSQLHSDELGVDKRLKAITLDSMPTLRNFTNDTLLDILFYTSPQYCQKIMDTVAGSLNDIYTKFRARQPEFNGGVSLAGHSLGSLILFDLLCHQNPIKECEDQQTSGDNQSTMNAANGCDSNLFTGSAGTGQPVINYCQLIFQPKKFFALGSPIGMFVTIRGIHKLGLDFRLPTCPGFYNIFHPYDPVAYRIEALVNPDITARPVLIPHHKGRKRMHLELKETMTRVSMDLKNRFFDKFKNTLDSYNIFGLSSSPKSKKEDEKLMKEEVEKVIEMQMQLEQQQSSLPAQLSPSESIDIPGTSNRQRTDSVCTAASDDMMELDMPLGKLNDSKRIDYVLQEAPLEIKYIFALSSHVCYWDSEDTILFVMKEIYTGLGVSPDSQIPQQSMTIERPSSRNSLIS